MVTSVIFGLIMKVYYFAFDVNYRRFTTGYELTDPLVFDKSTLGVFGFYRSSCGSVNRCDAEL